MFWARLKEHKVIQWGIAYLGAALALAHGAELMTHAFHWPEGVWRAVMIALIVGFPIALTVAWYHGHKGFQRITAGELSIVAVLVLIGAVIFTAALRPQAEHDASPAEATAVNTAGAAAVPPSGDASPAPGLPRQPNSLAVVPFVNNSPDADQEYFVDGLTGELINSLTRIRGLTVTGRTSSFTFKGTNENVRTIGERLGVEYVLEGSVQKSGERIRIGVQLVDARTEQQLWSEAYDRTFEDMFAIQDEITTEVAEGLQITLGVGDLGRFPGMTRNFAAYEEFLNAQGVRRAATREAAQSAALHYERAIELDPTFAEAWFALGDLYRSAVFVMPEEAEELAAKEAAAIARGRELAPDSPWASYAAAVEAMSRGAWREAVDFYERELPSFATRYPGRVDALAQTGQFLMNVGRPSDAISYLERARASEPLSGGIAMWLGEAYADVGALDAALAELERGLPLGEFAPFIAGTALLTALATGDREEIERRLPADDGDPNRQIARFLNDPAAGAAEVRRLAAELPAEQFVARDVLAHWAAYYDDRETALELVLLQHAFWRPVFADMRKLPGFKDLVRERGLVEYWREYGWSDFCQPIGDDDFECE